MKRKDIAIVLLMVWAMFSCKKAVQIAPPTNSIVSSVVFLDSADANAAVLGIYATIFSQSSANISAGNGAITFYCGSSADELIPVSTQPDKLQLYHNALGSGNAFTQLIWQQLYATIYQANSCIEGLQSSTSLKQTVKSQLMGESLFLRAFCHFYLANLFGDIPYVTTASGWQGTILATRTAKSVIFENIITDLKEAQDLLPVGYTQYGGQRTRVCREAAIAFLARVYLYSKDWNNAKAMATNTISNANYNLVDLNEVFTANSAEAILQWQPNITRAPFNVTPEGLNLLPRDTLSQPNSYFLSSVFFNSFEDGDARKIAWITKSVYRQATYRYPFKYKMGPAQLSANGTASEYYTVFRLAEQYLIRAEAEMQLNDLTNAISDINVIRDRATLPPLSDTLSKDEVNDAIMQERKIEFFSEWGHRWLDLKRTGLIDQVMKIVTPLKASGTLWDTNQQLYPIPPSDMNRDPNLTQNSGYN